MAEDAMFNLKIFLCVTRFAVFALCKFALKKYMQQLKLHKLANAKYLQKKSALFVFNKFMRHKQFRLLVTICVRSLARLVAPSFLLAAAPLSPCRFLLRTKSRASAARRCRRVQRFAPSWRLQRRAPPKTRAGVCL